MELRGWDYCDVIFFSGDAYVDHPSFGVAVIGRVLEAQGYRVGIVPQPDWHGDWRDFKKLGEPRLFFGIAPGCMDSMVNKYTANRRLRSEDAYSPDGRHDCRPEYPTIVYSKILRELFPSVPIVLGGIEASMRRLTHYDYWQERLRPSILLDSDADLIIYGMGERGIVETAKTIEEWKKHNDPNTSLKGDNHKNYRRQLVNVLKDIPQTVYLSSVDSIQNSHSDNDIVLHSHEDCLRDKRAEAENYRWIEEESNRMHAHRLLQCVGNRVVVVNPPYPPMTTAELDAIHELPYTRLPHPKYKGKRIPAFDMICNSVNIHRGCFGGCAFCTISAHQGKFVVSRSKESVMREVEKVTAMPTFKGTLSDLGGPSANMYGMSGRRKELCERCVRPSCIYPRVCKNLNTDHSALLSLYATVDAHPKVKHSYIGSGVRYDLLLHRSGDEKVDAAADRYMEELIVRHVSGRLKVAPEHTSDEVLHLMRKPSFELFREFSRHFNRITQRHHLREQLIPYFISSHPGCRLEDMALLAVETKNLDFHLEQVQDFTPTPMTISTEMWYTGLDPYTLRPVWSAKSKDEKLAQRQFFFWYKPSERNGITRSLRKIGRPDLISELTSQGQRKTEGRRGR